MQAKPGPAKQPDDSTVQQTSSKDHGQLLSDKFVQNTVSGFFFLLMAHVFLWEYENTTLGKSWNVALYTLAAVGTLGYLLWMVMKDRSGGEIKDVLKEKWVEIASMIPVAVGLMNIAKIAKNGTVPMDMGAQSFGMLAICTVVLCLQHLCKKDMSWGQVAMIIAGNIIVVAGYLTSPKKYFIPMIDLRNHRMYAGMCVFALPLLLASIMKGRAINKMVSSAVFVTTVVVSTAVSLVILTYDNLSQLKPYENSDAH
ncbi:DUF1686 domain-containing protein [Encephalitozoon hellem]|uniref:DUF1686 domain-containing protein n=1 Tax=Encephalitozoon hellem TaxID=27973 RepID=A0ABY8CLH0_ENCHE|nr:DUF1686 domain-containing protein [Encephalitozoon hellem]WEL39779.1 DUF1686 domain-containing protein [Encephalitozoon hellem]